VIGHQPQSSLAMQHRHLLLLLLLVMHHCTACRYSCKPHPHINLCPAAFAEGRFPPGTSSKDFVRVDRRQQVGG
jgi:hypothetical protein